jgi:hypothetical protein
LRTEVRRLNGRPVLHHGARSEPRFAWQVAPLLFIQGRPGTIEKIT